MGTSAMEHLSGDSKQSSKDKFSTVKIQKNDIRNDNVTQFINDSNHLANSESVSFDGNFVGEFDNNMKSVLLSSNSYPNLNIDITKEPQIDLRL